MDDFDKSRRGRSIVDDSLRKDKSRAERLKAKRKRNPLAEELRDAKGPYALRIVNPKKQEYKRKKLRVEEITYDDEEYD